MPFTHTALSFTENQKEAESTEKRSEAHKKVNKWKFDFQNNSGTK